MVGLDAEIGDFEGVLVPWEALSSMVLMLPKVAPVGVSPLWTLIRLFASWLDGTESSAMSDEPRGRATL